METSTKVQQWANWAEIVASIAIVVSLAFLIMEVRYNTRILERQAVLDRTAAFNTPFLEADYRVNGRSPALEAVAWSLLGSPDNQLYWDQGAPQVTSGAFRSYVSGLRAARAAN